MKVDKRANFFIFLVIAILALGLSNFAAAFTGDFVSGSFPGINDTDKLIALDDDNFSPLSLNAVYEPKQVVEEVNETDNETDTNSTIENETSDDSDNKNNNQNDNNNQNNNNDDNKNNDNSGGDNSDSKPTPTPSDEGDEE
ncbi:hypothetical protein [uncultured Methanobrevibacter sp.]|uniref:hypothetical protein n=1 Tax=uncultured Methanobrevibacter sp. TaxID=253161 RepID=UPI0025E2EE60|nr:hypothetical protein [uncultured Methanobrevibacter sp.]